MSDTKSATKELIELKYKIMLKKIEKLKSTYEILFNDEKNKEIESLKIIKEQYAKMYNKIMETKQYEKYKEIEDIIIKKISIIDLKKDEYIYKTKQNAKEILEDKIQKVYDSDNYKEFIDLNELDERVQTIKSTLKLYQNYMKKEKIETIQQEILRLKFEVLFRKQVYQYIYEDDNSKNYLKQYDNEKERETFEKIIAEKVKKYKIILDNSSNKGLEENKALEELIMIDIEQNPYKYISLVKAKIFNVHLCNIANNLYKEKIYVRKNEMKDFGFFDTGRKLTLETHFRPEMLVTDEIIQAKNKKINYLLLRGVISRIVIDEDISIIDCENLYKAFGFECMPIIMENRQECVKKLFDKLKENDKYFTNISYESNEQKNREEKKYCEIIMEGRTYEFEEVLEPGPEPENIFKRISSLVYINDEQNESSMSKNIAIIIAIKKKYQKELCRDKEHNRIEMLEKQKEEIEWLKKLKNKKDKLGLREKEKLLYMVAEVYDKLNIKYNESRIYPLEHPINLGKGYYFRERGCPECDICLNLNSLPSNLPIDYNKLESYFFKLAKLLTKEEVERIEKVYKKREEER